MDAAGREQLMLDVLARIALCPHTCSDPVEPMRVDPTNCGACLAAAARYELRESR